jgi:DNA-binding transcriptional regulator YdaS (Cro superfamily)
VSNLKVYGVSWLGTHRRVVAAASQSKAASLIGVSPSHMRVYGSETGNAMEIEFAMSEPGAVFETVDLWPKEYRRVQDKQEKVTP